MAIEEEESPGIPEWVVTFGDMMSLLLTFFIMLVSLSEMKQDEKFQAMVESVRAQFGHDLSPKSMVPGDVRARNSKLNKIANQGRAKRLDTHSGGAPVKSPIGPHHRALSLPTGPDSEIYAILYYKFGELYLSDNNQNGESEFLKLVNMADRLKGMPQIIEIKAHTSSKPLSLNPPPEVYDFDDLAYKRAKVIKERLVNELGIEARRIRITVEGDNDPLPVDFSELERNERVKVTILEEDRPRDTTIKSTQ